ncbi:MAG: DUF2249 domain-containing protein [Magnetococcales bacterium]|nr:DUF2249 domain-containing protein [Magnetococcales bacterium]MBF0155596.1 DUF2249 domain-containing protein [Magnetococcales bacterium]
MATPDDSTDHSPVDLDVRQLPPPEPLVRILEAVTRLAPGGEITVLHSRIPQLLYPRLQERGLLATTEVLDEGLVKLRIQRPVTPVSPPLAQPQGDLPEPPTPCLPCPPATLERHRSE